MGFLEFISVFGRAGPAQLTEHPQSVVVAILSFREANGKAWWLLVKRRPAFTQSA